MHCCNMWGAYIDGAVTEENKNDDEEMIEEKKTKKDIILYIQRNTNNEHTCLEMQHQHLGHLALLLPPAALPLLHESAH